MNDSKNNDPSCTTSCTPASTAKDLHRDPITGAPGSHPVGTGVGAASAGVIGGVAGAAIGGPVGAVAGAAVGAVIGGLAGKVTAEAVNPSLEAEYWKKNYSTRPYSQTVVFEEFAPAYQYGWESFEKRGALGKSFESVEAELGRDWDRVKGSSRLAWNQAKDASRDAWDRVRYSNRGNTKHAGA